MKPTAASRTPSIFTGRTDVDDPDARDGSAPDGADVLVPVLPHRRTPHTRTIPYVSSPDAFTTTYPTRACSTAYSLPAHPHRLVRDELDAYAAIGGVRMVLFVVDVDDESAHRSGASSASPEWRAAEREKVDALRAAHPRGFVYLTPRGWRAIYRLAEPFVIRTADDVERWRASYLAALAGLRTRFGIVADPAYARWGQTFDLPRIVRDGVALDLPTIGDPRAIGTFPLVIVAPSTTREHAERIGDATTSVLGRAFAARGVVGRERRGALPVPCPWIGEHTPHDPLDGSTVVFAPTTRDRLGRFFCSHSHCSHRLQGDVQAVLGISDDAPAVARLRAMMSEPEDVREVTLAEVESAVGDALRLASPGRLAVANPPAGSGKTRAAVQVVAASSAPAVYAVPTHELAGEVTERFEAVGVVAERRRGILRVLRSDGSPACAKHERARALVDAGGSIWRQLCPSCEHRKGCPARRRDPGQRVVVAPHALADAALDADDGEERPTLVVDESPELLTTMTLSRSDLDDGIRLLGSRLVDREWAESFEAWPRALRVAVDDPEHDLVGACARVDDDARRRREESGILAWARALPLPNAERVRSGDLRLDAEPVWRRDLELLALDADAYADAMRATRIFRALLAAAQDPTRIAWRSSGLAVHVDTPEARTLLRGGAVLLDATPPLDILRALCTRAGVGLMTMTLRVPDGAPVRRDILYSANASRSKLAPGRRVEVGLVEPLIVRALGRVPEGARALLVTHKPIADALRRGELREVLAGRVHVPEDVAHYGAVRGIDRWRDHDACITVGDPWPEIGAARERARVLGIDPDAHARDAARSELTQAHGRLRDPSRSHPAIHVHVGALAPFGWTTANATIEVRGAGRPRRTGPVTPVELLGFVQARGGQRAAALALGIPRRSLREYLAGRAVPPEVASRVTHRDFAPTSDVDLDSPSGGREITVKGSTGISRPPPSRVRLSRREARTSRTAQADTEAEVPRRGFFLARPDAHEAISRSIVADDGTLTAVIRIAAIAFEVASRRDDAAWSMSGPIMVAIGRHDLTSTRQDGSVGGGHGRAPRGVRMRRTGRSARVRSGLPPIPSAETIEFGPAFSGSASGPAPATPDHHTSRGCRACSCRVVRGAPRRARGSSPAVSGADLPRGHRACRHVTSAPREAAGKRDLL